MENNEIFATILLDIKAVSLSVNPPFTWSSGIKSPIYCDNRLLISFPAERKKIIDGFIKMITEKNITFDVIGGTATAAIPWAAFLAYELNKPMVYIRPEPKGHGKGKQVEGTMQPGSRVLIVEDLVSTGGSSLKSATACEQEFDARVTDVIAIFTYEMEEAREALAKKKIRLTTLSSFSTLLGVAETKGYLNPADKTSALTWSNNPRTWWETAAQ